MGETRRETYAEYFGAAMTIVPALIVSGFMPEWNVLPFAGWLAIATVGAGIAGAIAAPRPVRGAIAGALVGAGALLGVVAYVAIRAGLTGHHTFLSLEIGIGAILGGLPGALLYMKWAGRRATRSRPLRRCRPKTDGHGSTDQSPGRAR